MISSLVGRTVRDGLSFDVLRISYLVGAITLSSKFLFVIRDIMIAWTFGRSQALEAFILAFLIPFSFTNALSNSLTMTFLPHFIELVEEGKQKQANDIYSGLLGITLLVSLAAMMFVIFGYSFYAPIAAASFSVEGFTLMQFLLYFTAPAALINCFTNIWREILNAKGLFLRSCSASIITPLISIILLIKYPDTGVLILSLGLLIGAVLELIFLGTFLKLQGISLVPGSNFLALKLRVPIRDWWKAFISLALFNSMGLVNGVMAARRAEIGGLSLLNYGRKVVTLPNDIGAITYSSVLIPYLSKLMAAKNPRKVMRVLNQWVAIIFLTTIPLVILLMVFAPSIVQNLYQRGAFTAADSESVTVILRYYSIQIPFFIAFFVMFRVLPVIKKTPTALFGAAGVLLTVFFNYICIRILGTSGIALATSFVYMILSIGLYFYIRANLIARK
ncbi:MAG: hypothetical protein KDB79_00330 [Acidobacteria bacterium]|nr:hypothetical protein [Acidobacteriota bacterium]